MNDDTSELLRHKLQTSLPKIFGQVIDDYTLFTGRSAPDDAKHFSQHHTAGKAAALHLLALTKLVMWIEKHGTKHGDTDNADLESLLHQARATLLGHNGGIDDQEKDQL